MDKMKTCQYCGEEIKIKAIKCRHCQSMLDTGSDYSSSNDPETQKHCKQNKKTALWRSILGFRSLTPWKMIVGSLFYLCSIVYLFLVLSDPTAYVPFVQFTDAKGAYRLALMQLAFFVIVYTHINLASAITEKRATYANWARVFLIVTTTAVIVFVIAYFTGSLITREDIVTTIASILFVFLIYSGVSFSAASILFGIINEKSFIYIIALVGFTILLVIVFSLFLVINFSPI